VAEDASEEECVRHLRHPIAFGHRWFSDRTGDHRKLSNALLLPNERAIEPQITAIYRRFGLNDRQIELLSRATPKRDYYCQSRRGNRMFELGLGEVALAFTAASSKIDQAAIEQLLAEHGRDGFVPAWLQHRDVAWATDLIPNLGNLERSL